jgi:hypothetical protein
MDKKKVFLVEDAVDEYMNFKIKESKDDFLYFLNEMTSTYGQKFKLINPKSSGLDFLLVRIALDCINLWSFFPADKADEILKTIIKKYLSTDGADKKYNIDEIFGYMDILEGKTGGKETGTKFQKVTERFLRRILGDNIKSFYVGEPKLDVFKKIWAKNKELIDPLLIGQGTNLLLKYSVSWSAIRNNATIV